MLPWLIGGFAALIALAAIYACAVLDSLDESFDEDWTPTPEELQASREREKSQLIVTAMKRDRDAAFAAWAGTPFGEVPRIPPKEGA
jgi:cell division septation protein DedD